MKIALFVVAGWWTFGTLVSIAMIGKPRKPMTPRAAVFMILIDAFIIAVVLKAALRS